MAVSREVTEGRQVQGVDEEIKYTITTTNWGSTPTDVACVVKDMTDGNADVTSTVMPDGSISVSGNIITLKSLKSLTEGKRYRVEVKFTTSDGNVWEPFFYVTAEL